MTTHEHEFRNAIAKRRARKIPGNFWESEQIDAILYGLYQDSSGGYWNNENSLFSKALREKHLHVDDAAIEQLRTWKSRMILRRTQIFSAFTAEDWMRPATRLTIIHALANAMYADRNQGANDSERPSVQVGKSSIGHNYLESRGLRRSN